MARSNSWRRIRETHRRVNRDDSRGKTFIAPQMRSCLVGLPSALSHAAVQYPVMDGKERRFVQSSELTVAVAALHQPMLGFMRGGVGGPFSYALVLLCQKERICGDFGGSTAGAGQRNRAKLRGSWAVRRSMTQ